MRKPGLEPGFRRWQRRVITTTLLSQCHLAIRSPMKWYREGEERPRPRFSGIPEATEATLPIATSKRHERQPTNHEQDEKETDWNERAFQCARSIVHGGGRWRLHLHHEGG